MTAISTDVFWPPNVEKKNFHLILLGHSNSLLFYILTFHIWNEKGDGSHNINIFVLNHCDIVWLPLCVCVCLFVLGSLVVFFVGLPGEASAAWSPLLHQTVGQEMCSAPQHSGRIHFLLLSSSLCCSSAAILCVVTPMCVCCTHHTSHSSLSSY